MREDVSRPCMTRSEAHAQQITWASTQDGRISHVKGQRRFANLVKAEIRPYTSSHAEDGVCLYVAQCTATALIGPLQSSPWLSMVTSECLSQARRLEQVAHGQSTPCRLHSIKRLLLLQSYTEIEDTPPARIPRKTPNSPFISPSPTNPPRYPAKHVSQA